MNRRVLIPLASVVVMMGVVSLRLRRPRPSPPPARMREVRARPRARVTPPAPASKIEPLEQRLEGTLSAADSHTVIAPFDSRVIQCLVRVGERVIAGQLLARLDCAPVEAALRAARQEAAHARAEQTAADLALLEHQQELAAARAALVVTQARLGELRREAQASAAALATARTATVEAISPPPPAPVTGPAPELIARIHELETEQRPAMLTLQEETETLRSRTAERLAAERLYAKSRELHAVGAISRNAFEADRTRAEQAVSRVAEAEPAVARARERVAGLRERLKQAKEARARALASPPAARSLPSLPARELKEVEEARNRVERSSRLLAQVVADVRTAQTQIERLGQQARDLERRREAAESALPRAIEEVANQTLLLGTCELKASGEGILRRAPKRNQTVHAAEMVFQIDDETRVRFVPHGPWLQLPPLPERVTLIQKERRWQVRVLPEVEGAALPPTYLLENSERLLPAGGSATLTWKAD